MIRQHHFRCSLDTAVYTTRRVIDLGKPITIVLHESDDGNWKFLSKEDADNSAEGLMLVSLEEILMIDPTISEIAYVKEGNLAIRRFIGDEWKTVPIKQKHNAETSVKVESNL